MNISVQRFFSVQSGFIWLPPEKKGEFDVDIGAKVININQSQIKVVDDDGKV